MNRPTTILSEVLLALNKIIRVIIIWLKKLLFENDGRRIFAIGFSIFLVAKVFLVAAPILSRVAPVEPDDGYTYALRASQIIYCRDGDCPALESLKTQVLRSTSDQMHSLSLGELYNRVFVYSQPLYLFFLASLNNLGFSWEASLGLLSLFGIVFICFSLGYWLNKFWGPGAAGVGLILLAFQTFHFEGLSVIRGSNVTLAVALIIWTIIIKGPAKLMFWVPIGVAIMLAMHNIGLAYALVTLLLVIVLGQRPFTKPTRFIVASIAILIIALFMLRLFLKWPELSLQTDIFFPDSNYLELLGRSVPSAAGIIRNWLISMWSIENALVLLLLGFFSVKPVRRMATLLMLTILGGLFIGGIFYPLPLDPIEIFPRIWLPLAIFLTGAIGQGIWMWLSAILGWIERIAMGNIPTLTDRRALFSASGWNLFFVLLLSVVVIFSLADSYRLYLRNYFRTLESRTTDASLAFDPAQTDTLLSEIKEGEVVLYMNMVPMTYYLAQGAIQHPAVLYQAITDQLDIDLWLEEGQTLSYLVVSNPIHKLPNIRNSAIWLNNGDPIGIVAPSESSITYLAINLDNPQSDEVPLTVEYASKNSWGEKELAVPANWSGWMTVFEDLFRDLEGVTSITLKTKSQVYINGFRVRQDQQSNWPWNRGVQLLYGPKGSDEAESIVVDFETSELSKSLDLSVRVIDDSGSSVLARIIE